MSVKLGVKTSVQPDEWLWIAFFFYWKQPCNKKKRCDWPFWNSYKCSTVLIRNETMICLLFVCVSNMKYLAGVGWLWKVCVFSITQFLYWAKSKVTKFLSTYQIISHIIGNSENNAVIAETDGDNVVDSNDAYEARLCRSIWRVLSVDLWCGVVISFVYRGFFFLHCNRFDNRP